MATMQSGLDSRTWKRGRKGLKKVNNKEMMVSSSSSLAENNIIPTEELKFWLRCCDYSLKGLETKACLAKQRAHTLFKHVAVKFLH